MRCGDDGFCYQGATPCLTSWDDPLCNIPSQDAAETEAWRACRQLSAKVRAMRTDHVYGGAPFHAAAMLGRSELIEEGVDVNVRGHGAATALHMATLLPAGTGVVQFLLANGAAVNAVDAYGYTPLHRFVESDNVLGVTMLLSHGANVTRPAPGVCAMRHLLLVCVLTSAFFWCIGRDAAASGCL